MEHGDPFQDGERLGREGDDDAVKEFIAESPSLRPGGTFLMSAFAQFARGLVVGRVGSKKQRPSIADLRCLIPAQ